MTSKNSKKSVTKKSSTVDTSSAASAPSPEVSTTPPIAAVAAAPITPPGDMPPAVGAPAPRAGWEPAKKKKRSARGARPKAAQVNNALASAKEISQSTTYVADFGSRAPAADGVAFVITNAARWRDTWSAAKKFLVYAGEQRAAWENEAQAQMSALKPAFDYVVARDPAVATKYAATSKYLGAVSAIATRAVATRKQKAALKAKKGAAAQAPSVSPTPAPIPTPTVAWVAKA